MFWYPCRPSVGNQRADGCEVSTEAVVVAVDPDLVQDFHWHELRDQRFQYHMECVPGTGLCWSR